MATMTTTTQKAPDTSFVAEGASTVTARKTGTGRALLLFSTPMAYLDNGGHLLFRGHMAEITLKGERAVFSEAIEAKRTDATVEVDIPSDYDEARHTAEGVLTSLWRSMTGEAEPSFETIANIRPSGEAAPWLGTMDGRSFIDHCLGRLEVPRTHRSASIDRIAWDFLEGAKIYGSQSKRVYLTQDLLDPDIENDEGLLRSVARDLLLHYRDLDQVRDWLKEPLRRGFNLRRAHLGGAHWTLVRRRSATLAVIERIEGTDILGVRVEDADPTSETEPTECPSVDLFDLTPERCEFYEFSDPWGEDYRSTTPLKLATLSARKGQSLMERELPPL